jgi:cyanate permease
MGGSCGLYGFLFFLPMILRRSFGYSQIASFCLTAPPAAFAIIISVGVSWLADKTRMRGPYAVLECVIGVVGLAMTGFLKDPTPRYIGTFLGEAGTTALIVTSLAWGQNNIRSDSRRSVVTVIQVVGAAVGGIYSALVFRQQVSSIAHYVVTNVHTVLLTEPIASGRPGLSTWYHSHGCPFDLGRRVVNICFLLPLEGQ